MKFLRFAVAALIAALASVTVLTSATAAGSREYIAVSLVGLGGDTEAQGINERGEVVGLSRTSAGNSHAVMWTTSGALVDLGTLGGSESSATAINNKGEVVGWSLTKDGNTHAFLWKNGQMSDIGLASSGCDAFSFSRAINDRGQVAGTCASGAAVHASLWENGLVTDLGIPGSPGDMSGALDINERGQVVGQIGSPRAAMWDKGTLTVLSEDYSYANGINNAGDVVGHYWVGGPDNHAFLWSRGSWQDLGVGEARTINDRDQIAGTSWNGTFYEAVLWENGDVQVLPHPGDDAAFAVDINNRGQIVGGYWNGTSNSALLWERTGWRSE